MTGSQQSHEVVFPAGPAPAFLTVPGDGFAQPFVLTPGNWFIHIRAEGVLLVRAHIHIHTRAHTHALIHMQTHMHAHTHTHTHMRMHIHTYAHNALAGMHSRARK